MTERMLLNYGAVDRFRKEYFKNLLEDHNLIEGEKFFKTVLDIEGDEKDINAFGFIFQKEGRKYLLESAYIKELPIGYDNDEKIAYRGEAYYRILDPFPVIFRPVRELTMRGLVDKMSMFKHTQPLQYKIDVMMGLTQVLSKAFFRKSSQPSFGKDSTVATLGSLSQKALTIENPTIAKLELLARAKLLAVNELNDISKAEWKMIEQFLLAVGAFKETYTKRSRATSGVGEILDISPLSVSIMYNDIDCYENCDAYFDKRATKQCKDRFPALRFYGHFTEDFNALDGVNLDKYVKDHWDEYVGIVRTLAYFSNQDNLMKELKHFTLKEPLSKSNRWNNSLNKLLRIVDLYCETQEEFDLYVGEIKKCMKEYEDMVKYPELVQQLCIHLKVKTEDRKDIFNLQQLLNHFNGNTPESQRQTPRFKTIVSTIHNYINEDSFSKLQKDIRSFIASGSKSTAPTVADLNSKKW